MTNKQALREAAEKATKGEWVAEFDDEVYSTDGVNSQQIAMVFSENESLDAAFIAAASPVTVLDLLDELEALKELVELQRFKLERQAEDLHQAKSLESIHREKRYEAEREFSSYKERAESNTRRLAQEVCRLEDELQAAGIRINGEG